MKSALIMIFLYTLFPCFAQINEGFQARASKAWKEDPKKLIRLYWNWGNIYHSQGDRELAVRAWLSVLEVAKPDWKLYLKLATRLHRYDYKEEAIEVLDMAAKYLPLKISQHMQGVKLALRWRQNDLAGVFLNRILQKSPRHQEATRILLSIYNQKRMRFFRDGKAKEAIKLNRKIYYYKKGMAFVKVRIELSWDLPCPLKLRVTSPTKTVYVKTENLYRRNSKLTIDLDQGNGGPYRVEVEQLSENNVTVHAQMRIIFYPQSKWERRRSLLVTLSERKTYKVAEFYIPKEK